MTPDTVLVRAPSVTVHLERGEDVWIAVGEERLEATPHALLVLHAFANPRSIADALTVTASGPQHWIELSSTVLQLARAGILIAPGSSAASLRGWDRPGLHVVMLDDHARTNGFIRALQALVRPEDVVVDIGTGTGILATAAALAGAARVHAIESGAMAEVAEKVFSTNGVADRTRIHRGRSTSLSLPERCDLLVTELIGNDPLDEQILEVVADAKARFLTPGARMIPSALELVAIPVDIPRPVFEQSVFTAERVAAWRAMYGVDLSPLVDVRAGPSQSMLAKAEDVLEWPQVAPPLTLITIDFAEPFDLALEAEASFVLEHDVERLGIVLAFRATLAPDVVLSTVPGAAAPTNHWHYKVWPAMDRLSLVRGTSVRLDYSHARKTTTLTVA